MDIFYLFDIYHWYEIGSKVVSIIAEMKDRSASKISREMLLRGNILLHGGGLYVMYLL